MHALQNSARFLRCILNVPRCYLIWEKIESFEAYCAQIAKKKKNAFYERELHFNLASMSTSISSFNPNPGGWRGI
jgi:hypothetical protein